MEQQVRAPASWLRTAPDLACIVELHVLSRSCAKLPYAGTSVVTAR